MNRVCASCGWAGLPIREVCPNCDGTAWLENQQAVGIVRAVTRVHRALGSTFEPAQVLALVELDSGGWVIGTGSDPEVGARVIVGPNQVLTPAGRL